MKIGRNDPCSCGSGRKYKQCCLLNKNKDISTLIRETVDSEGYNEEMADVLCKLVRYIKEKQWMGACHAISSVLYVVFSELGYKVELFVGEVQKPEYPPFDHSWIKLDGKVIDIAVIMTLMRGMPISDAVVLDKDIVTKQTYDIKYGINTVMGLDYQTQVVIDMPFVEYLDAFLGEKGGLWDVIDIVSPVKWDRDYLKEKYRDTKRVLVKE